MILNRLKLAWCALWYGRIRVTVTMAGRDQTKGYLQRWVFHVEHPGEDFRVLRAADQVRGEAQSHEDLVAHYRDHFAGDDLESEVRPVDPDVIDAVRDTPADPKDPDGPTLRDLAEAGAKVPLEYLAHESMTQQERDEVILKDWKRRHPK